MTCHFLELCKHISHLCLFEGEEWVWSHTPGKHQRNSSILSCLNFQSGFAIQVADANPLYRPNKYGEAPDSASTHGGSWRPSTEKLQAERAMSSIFRIGTWNVETSRDIKRI